MSERRAVKRIGRSHRIQLTSYAIPSLKWLSCTSDWLAEWRSFLKAQLLFSWTIVGWTRCAVAFEPRMSIMSEIK
jgi:hypothetical protein